MLRVLHSVEKDNSNGRRCVTPVNDANSLASITVLYAPGGCVQKMIMAVITLVEVTNKCIYCCYSKAVLEVFHLHCQ